MYGIDIFRFFELSWLSSTGKPNVAVLEIKLDSPILKAVDTFALKKQFNTYAMKSFNSKKELETHILHGLKNILPKVEIVIIDVDGAGEGKTFYDFFQHLRFICPVSQQPFLGMVVGKGDNQAKEVVSSYILKNRDKEILPHEYANDLYLNLQKVEKFAFAVHLCRRGGISQQYNRSNEPLKIPFARAIVE